MSNYSYNLLLFNHLKEEVTFKYTSGQGNANPPSIKLAHKACKWMTVTNAPNVITLKVKPKTKKAKWPNRIIFKKPQHSDFSECPGIISKNCTKKKGTPPDKKHWNVTITHCYEKGGLISGELLDKEMPIVINLQDVKVIYTNGKKIMTDPPAAQTPVTATDRQYR
jgi:hypothetical protein